MRMGHFIAVAAVVAVFLAGWEARGARTAAALAGLERDLAAAHTTLDSLTAELRQRPRDLRRERDSIVARAARRLGVDPVLALAIAWVENPTADSAAVSAAGAVGLLQVMSPRALALRGNVDASVARAVLIVTVCGRVDRLVERRCNALVGLRIYRGYLERYADVATALAAYNGALDFPASARVYVDAVRRNAQRAAALGTL